MESAKNDLAWVNLKNVGWSKSYQNLMFSCDQQLIWTGRAYSVNDVLDGFHSKGLVNTGLPKCFSIEIPFTEVLFIQIPLTKIAFT